MSIYDYDEYEDTNNKAIRKNKYNIDNNRSYELSEIDKLCFSCKLKECNCRSRSCLIRQHNSKNNKKTWDY